MRCHLIVTALLAFISAERQSRADTVFFEDFDDPSLAQWNLPNPFNWQYNVSNSMLNVTGLFFPSNPKSNVNYAAMSARFESQTDFQMDVWMGWDANEPPHRLETIVHSPFGGLMAWMGYRNEGLAGPQIFAGGGGAGAGFSMPAPDPGIHHFTISRTGSQFNFFFNGSHFGTFQGSSNPAASAGFFFVGPFPGEFGGYHIDQVMVVPTPVGLATLWVFALHSNRSRRR